VSRIAISTTTDAGYLPAACCQICSVFDHLQPGAAELFLVCCDVTQTEIEAASAFFSIREIPVHIIQAQPIAERIKPLVSRWPRAAYLRLYFDELFDRSYDRLVYFDADTRVRAPLKPLLDAKFRGLPVAAVHDFIYYVTGNIRRRRNELGLAPSAPYLQSGVMLLDWPAVLDQGLLARARKFLHDFPEACREAPDQDALNHALENLWTPLDPRWNLHETYLNFGGRLVPYIEHYTSTKPWSRKRPARWNAAADWYACLLEDTMWADFIPAQSPVDRIEVEAAFLKFRYGPKVRNLLSRYSPAVLDLMGVPRLRSDAEELPWSPRSRRDVEDMAEALVAEAQATRAPIRPPESALHDYGRGRPIGL
jgi:lipopolysaccharide biosynthesis glycosyltransferase